MYGSEAGEVLSARSLSETRRLRHGFFTRRGGVSSGLYASLNCGPGSKDEPPSIAENRSRVARRLGTDPPRLVTPWQVHSAEAVIVTEPWAIDDAGRPRADGIATAVPGLAIGVLTADCAPVLLADPDAGVIGAAHAGWRGAAAGVIEATVAAMQTLGARREAIRAAIGPCIGPEVYEVGPEFEAELLALSAGNARYFRRDGASARARFDLPGYVESRLAAAGIAAVEGSPACTYADAERFYSYRRATHRNEPDYGRQISAIMIAES